MDTHSVEEAKERFEKLPEEVKKLLYSWEMTSAITKVGEKNQLHVDQMDILNTETGQVMLGFTQTRDYPQILMESLKVDRIKADAIAQDINDLLFVKIRDSMKVVDSTPASIPEKTVQMPSAAARVVPTKIVTATPTPTPTPPLQTSIQIPKPQTPAVPAITELHSAELMLREKTISTAPNPVPPPTSIPKTASPKPPTQKIEPIVPTPPKVDPYREPPTP